jgi:hypothetical protein
MDVGVAGIARLSVVVAEALFRVAVRVAVWLEASAAVVAEKVPVDDPAASAIEAGTFRALDVFVSVTITPFAGAGRFSETVQVLELFGPRIEGEQLSEVGVAGATRLRIAVAETLFRVAVSVAVWLVLSAAVVTGKVPVADPAATATEGGTVRALALFVSVTVAPFAGAGWFKVTVQALDPFGPKVEGEQLSETGVATNTRLTVVVLETLFRVAMTVAVWLVLSAAVVTGKVPVADPAATATEGGTVRALALFVSVTVDPFAGAGW